MASLTWILAPSAALGRLTAQVLDEWAKAGIVLTKRLERPTWAQLLPLLEERDLFAPRQGVCCLDAEGLGAAPKDLAPRLQGGGDWHVLFVSSKKPKKTDFPPELWASVRVIEEEAPPTWPEKRQAWLMGLARARGVKLTSEGAALLVDWVSDGEELRAKVDLLARLNLKEPVTPQVLRLMAEDEGARDTLKVLDALATADEALLVAALASCQKRGDLIPLLSAVQNRVRAAFYVALWGDGAAGLLQLTAYQTKIARQSAGLYGERALAQALWGICRLSLLERRGEGESWPGLELCLLRLCAERKKRR